MMTIKDTEINTLAFAREYCKHRANRMVSEINNLMFFNGKT